MLLTCLSELGINIEHKHFFMKLQGDDSLVVFSEASFFLYGKRFLEMMSKIAMTRFNAKLSVDKSDIHDRLDGVYVLGYYNKQGISYRTDLDLMSHLLFPERSQTIEATASSALGIALASMGCSEQVYNTCLDVYTFISEELGKTPSPLLTSELDRKRLYLFGTEIDTSHFPSLFTIKMQNYVLVSRTESDKQRTWPTDPTRTGGFCFI